ncbi:MAG: homocysteine methyltransferase [Deltaproteobacteria bacterium]|nr:MAG: homocysteine methyltransferase [Deltaproteobacteria bacterium]
MIRPGSFTITIEVVPPEGTDCQPLLTELSGLAHLKFDGFSVATNPLAKPCMSAMVVCSLIQQQIGKPAILHCTPRDHNRLGIFSLLSGARAMGIDNVLVATGDFVALKDRENTRAVYDMNVFELVKKARELGLKTGVVLDPNPGSPGFKTAVKRLEQKAEAGAQFIVTQPVYDMAGVEQLADATRHLGIPLVMGILPLRTAGHAEFLHHRVSGISVPRRVRERMARADDSVAEGVANAREMLSAARDFFAGVCIMPPFNHYEVMTEIVAPAAR